jgi:transposase
VTPSDAEIIEQLKQQLDATTRQLDVTSQRLQLSELRVQLLEDKLRLQRIAKYGPGSEKLTNQQLELLELEPGVSNLEVAAEDEREVLPAMPDKKKRKHPGRQTLPADLPRVERVIVCAAEQCVCGGCGQSTTVIGYEESQQLDVEPIKYFVLVTRREKRACKSCEERGVMAAPLPPRIIEKSLVSDQVILDAIIGKYSNHCPLYRQSAILLRDAGIDISRATIDGWVMRVGDLLTPLVAVMGRELLEGTYIQADETPVEVQTRDGRSRNHPGYLWQYGTPGGTAIFEFRMGRGREGPMRFLENFAGILQTDAYAAYDRVGGPKMVHAACWAHSRRRFVEATKLNQQDVASTRIVAQMAKLFAIDAQARDENMNFAARHTLAHGTGSVGTQRTQGADRGCQPNGTPIEPTRQGIFLHPSAVAQAHSLLRLCRAGAEQQPCGELHAPGGDWPSQLDPHRSREGRTTRCRNPLHRRNLPPTQDPGP